MMKNLGEAILNDLIHWVLALLRRGGMVVAPFKHFKQFPNILPGFTSLVPVLEQRQTRLSRGPTRFHFRSRL